ncbi:MAG: MTAP family purine nucleoside phosphorylase [Armatimonadota bacterium]|nr:MTAP family purine nucleoside phosphorylase [Armatimonadota bacterium]
MSTALIGGTGIDELSEFTSGRRLEVSTRFGHVELAETSLGGRTVFFLPRHGFAHSVPPSLINYRANIAGLKKLGVTRIISLSAVGSLTPELKVGSFAILGDFIDMTRRRPGTFFDEPGSPVAHTDFSEPYCPELTKALVEACRKQGVCFLERAVYVGVEGPRYETPAEVKLFASWGGHVVGMTNVPEVVLAKEAGICFAGLAIVANLACGLGKNRLTHEEVRKVVAASGKTAATILREALQLIPTERKCTCGENLALVI